MKLLIDIGKTRLKWALARDGAMVEAGAVAHDGAPADVLERLPAAAVEAVWIAHVTGAELETRLGATVRNRYAVDPQYARSQAQWRGLRSAYDQPERLGIDRWLVMVAAWARRQGACCVVDAGTALTADCIDAQGQHQGGFIAAGLLTQQRAVLGATRFATRAAERRYDGGLGQDTEACVRQGAMLACLGAIDRALALAGPDAQRLITGGDAQTLLAQLPTGWQYRPDLVLEGLLELSNG